MIRRDPFGRLADGTAIDAFVLTSAALELRVITLGAVITSLRTADRAGERRNIVLGHDSLPGYVHNPDYLGAVVGRYANRIAHGRFCIDGQSYQLATNDGAHHLHGGLRGFDQGPWTLAGPVGDATVALSRFSPAGEEGYPGALRATVTYTLRDDHIVEIGYAAVADDDTLVNLTQHTYFNLSGDMSSLVLDHELTIHGECYLPVDATMIPEGRLAPVAGTPFDFRRPQVIGEQMAAADEQLRRAGGFDHNWVLDPCTFTPAPAARLRHPLSGRVLDVATTEPGLQFYAGQWLGTRTTTPGPFRPHAGLCLETQRFPDSPNRPFFPSTILRRGQRYESLTTWTFTVN